MTIGSRYLRPSTVPAALQALASEEACVLAGGTDLVLMRAADAVSSQTLVDVKGIADLRGVHATDGWTTIGACTSLDDLIRWTTAGSTAITDGAALVGGWQTRVRATIGGNVCRASPSADTLCGLLVNDAEVELASSTGTRRVPLRQFLIGPGVTVRRSDELLTRLRVPKRPGGSAYIRYTPRNAMDLAIAGVAVRVTLRDGTCAEAAVAIGACGPTPLLVPDAAARLIGTAGENTAIADIADLVVAAARPIDDVRGTRRHRLRVLPSLVRDAIRIAIKRAAAQPGRTG